MAEFIAEGIRFNNAQAVVKKIVDIDGNSVLAGYDGYIFGSPTFSLDIPKPVKTFLSMTKNTNLEGKLCGAFGPYLHDESYRHDDYAPALIFNILQNEHRMKPFDLGPFSLREEVVETREGMKACQDYGRIFGQKLDN